MWIDVWSSYHGSLFTIKNNDNLEKTTDCSNSSRPVHDFLVCSMMMRMRTAIASKPSYYYCLVLNMSSLFISREKINHHPEQLPIYPPGKPILSACITKLNLQSSCQVLTILFTHCDIIIIMAVATTMMSTVDCCAYSAYFVQLI